MKILTIQPTVPFAALVVGDLFVIDNGQNLTTSKEVYVKIRTVSRDSEFRHAIVHATSQPDVVRLGMLIAVGNVEKCLKLKIAKEPTYKQA